MNEKDLCMAKIVDRGVIWRSDHFFVTDRGMKEATGNDGWLKSVFCMTLFHKMKSTFNEDGTIRGCWCWIYEAI